jgi:glucosylceramidase
VTLSPSIFSRPRWPTPGLRLSLLVLLLIVVVGNSRALAVDVWLTKGDKSQLMSQQTDLLLQSGNGSGGLTINVDPGTTYQTMQGFGASLTDSSAWLIQNRLSTTQRDKLMKLVFSPETGAGMNYLRLPMGASDFTASGVYTYNDLPTGQTDGTQSHFSIAHDEQYIIPQLLQAKSLNPDLKIMGTPWSAPAWMKTNKSLYGGSLDPQWYGSYAVYLKDFVQAYAAEGLPIDSISLQNEPENVNLSYPTTSMTAAQQADIIKNHLGPLFAAAGIDTKVLIYDHNWDDPGYAMDILSDSQASQYVAGTAFHSYAGDVSAQSTVHDAHPDKGIYFTETSGFEAASNFSDNLVWGMRNIIIGGARNWSENAIYWNLALDENSGPHVGGCSDCRGVVTIDSGSGAVTPNEEFYTIAHASKFVQPGAVRIDSSFYANSLETVAFRNPDGSKVLIALNPGTSTRSFRIVDNGQHISYSLGGKSVATFVWDGAGADFDNGGFEQLGGSTGGWTTFGNAIGNVSAAQEAVLDGDSSLKLYGQFNGSANESGVWQGMTVSPGDIVQASADSFVRSLDSIAGTNNSVTMTLEFYDTFGATGAASLLGTSDIVIADGSVTPDFWENHQLQATAPAGAVEARLMFTFFQPSNQSGAVHIDLSELKILSNYLPGDFNEDGVIDAADYTKWRDAMSAGASSLPNDPTPGTVDESDFLYWRDHFGETSSPGSGAGAAQSAVPEPTTATLLLIAGAALAISRP